MNDERMFIFGPDACAQYTKCAVLFQRSSYHNGIFKDIPAELDFLIWFFYILSNSLNQQSFTIKI